MRVSGIVVFAHTGIHRRLTNVKCVMFGKEHQQGMYIVRDFELKVPKLSHSQCEILDFLSKIPKEILKLIVLLRL